MSIIMKYGPYDMPLNKKTTPQDVIDFVENSRSELDRTYDETITQIQKKEFEKYENKIVPFIKYLYLIGPNNNYTVEISYDNLCDYFFQKSAERSRDTAKKIEDIIELLRKTKISNGNSSFIVFTKYSYKRNQSIVVSLSRDAESVYFADYNKLWHEKFGEDTEKKLSMKDTIDKINSLEI